MGNVKSKKLGKRATKTWERNDAIRKAAMALARRRKWPSPPAIAEKTGISASVIERETELLLDARREWENVTGQKHPQWRDPEATKPGAAGEQSQAAQDGHPKEVGDDPARRWADKAKRDSKTIRNQRQTIANQNAKIAELAEQVRRLLIQVRPPELGLILEAGAPKRRKGKSKKCVAVGP